MLERLERSLRSWGILTMEEARRMRRERDLETRRVRQGVWVGFRSRMRVW